MEDKNANTVLQEDLTGTMADVDEIMKKYDRESNTRPWEGVPAMVIKVLLAAFSLFMIYMNLFTVWDERIRRPLFLGIIVIFVFVLFPARKNTAKPMKVNHIPIYDIILAVAGSGSFFYFVINNKTIINHATHISTLEIWLGVIGIIVLAECCRRVTGIPILVVAGCFVIYAFASNLANGKAFYKISGKSSGTRHDIIYPRLENMIDKGSHQTVAEAVKTSLIFPEIAGRQPVSYHHISLTLFHISHELRRKRGRVGIVTICHYIAVRLYLPEHGAYHISLALTLLISDNGSRTPRYIIRSVR